MSRKPRAIRLSTSKQTNVDEPLKKASDTIKLKSETKPKKAKAKPTKSSDSSPRAPRVMAAPKIDEEAYDPFDQSPFINSEDWQVVSTHLPDMNKGIKWGSIMFSAVLALMSIGFTFWAVELVEAFFARNPLLGWLTFSLSVLFVIALFALLLREFLAIRNLRRIGNLREEAEQVLLDNGPVKPVERKLIALYSTRSDMQWHLDKVPASPLPKNCCNIVSDTARPPVTAKCVATIRTSLRAAKNAGFPPYNPISFRNILIT